MEVGQSSYLQIRKIIMLFAVHRNVPTVPPADTAADLTAHRVDLDWPSWNNSRSSGS